MTVLCRKTVILRCRLTCDQAVASRDCLDDLAADSAEHLIARPHRGSLLTRETIWPFFHTIVVLCLCPIGCISENRVDADGPDGGQCAENVMLARTKQ